MPTVAFGCGRSNTTDSSSADRDGSARYAFVLFDVSDREPTAMLKQRDPATVGRQIGARGGWGPSGHDSQGEQYKLPIEAVFPEWSE